MSVSAGIVGLPNAGKSTLFNALAGRDQARVAPFPFTTVDPNEAVVTVPDKYLMRIAELVKPEKVTPATIVVRDIAGLIQGAHKGEGLGNQFLAHIREVDIVWFVLRGFENTSIPHPEGTVDPVRDYQIVMLELTFKDIETVQNRIDRLTKKVKGDPSLKEIIARLEQLLRHLNNGKPARDTPFTGEKWFRELHLLTAKPQICVLNTDLTDFSEIPAHIQKWLDYFNRQSIPAVVMNADIESQLPALPREEVRDLLNEMNLNEPVVNKLIELTVDMLRLVRFYTITGGREVKAWLAPAGTTYREAARKIHTDFYERFIKAEVIKVSDFLQLGSEQACRDAGKVRIAGPDDKVEGNEIVKILI